jgi:hypothetical protein
LQRRFVHIRLPFLAIDDTAVCRSGAQPRNSVLHFRGAPGPSAVWLLTYPGPDTILAGIFRRFRNN